MPYEIIPAYNDIETLKILFNEYTSSLGIDLTFQDYEQEIRDLPGKYDLPRGRLYIIYDGAPAGCIGLRPLNQYHCEMKRLYVRHEFRGKGFGKILAQKILDDAKEIGYTKMYLDTLLSLDTAVKMYKQMGFREIEPYYDNPYPNVAYFCMELQATKTVK